MKESILEVVEMELSKLHECPWNANEQTDVTFNQLVEEIKEEGFDEPLQVCPCDCDQIQGEHYTIIGGNHRYKAVTVLSWTKVPVTIRTDWDLDKQKIKTVRRNLMTGELNEAKFMRIVKDLEENGYTRTELPDLLGFDSDKDFAKYVSEDKDEADKSWLDAMLAESNKEVEAVDGLSDILNNIMADSGDTIDQNYMFFTYKGKAHLMVIMDDGMLKETEEIVEHLQSSGENINDYMRRVLPHGRESQQD